MERTELEKSLAALAKANDFSSVTIGFVRNPEGHEWFTAVAHFYNATTESGHGCAVAQGDTIAEAVFLARMQIADQRAVTIADEAIPMGEAA